MARAAIAYLNGDETPSDLDPAGAPPGEGFGIVAVVRDDLDLPRSGLAEALERIAAGEATALVVPRLAVLAGSLRELVALLDWIVAAGADLVALDVGLDTGSPGGARTVAVLHEVVRWDREPVAGRPARGRPGIAVRAPELSARITAMRDRGLSLQAIADALNADGVPTQRGGARWRPSSVQVALGYRRPPPPPPLAPPAPPHPRPAPPRHPRPAPSRSSVARPVRPLPAPSRGSAPRPPRTRPSRRP